jgi:hypothetical protein
MRENIKNTGLVGQLVVIIEAFTFRKIAARLIAENDNQVMVENKEGYRSIFDKDRILLIRKPFKTHKNNPDGGDDLDEVLCNH